MRLKVCTVCRLIFVTLPLLTSGCQSGTGAAVERVERIAAVEKLEERVKRLEEALQAEQERSAALAKAADALREEIKVLKILEAANSSMLKEQLKMNEHLSERISIISKRPAK